MMLASAPLSLSLAWSLKQISRKKTCQLGTCVPETFLQEVVPNQRHAEHSSQNSSKGAGSSQGPTKRKGKEKTVAHYSPVQEPH